MPARSSFIADGQQVQATDLDSFANAASSMVGRAVTSIVGVSDANVDDSPLTVVPGTGLSAVVGGTGQAVLVQGRLADYLPAQTVVLATAAPSAVRYDLLAFAYADVVVATGATARFEDVYGNITQGPTSFVYRGITLVVVKGTAGGGLPAAPSGFDSLAQIRVQAGATSLTAADITILLPTISGLLRALVGGGVASLNGETGALSLVPGSGNIVITPTGTSIRIDLASAPSLSGLSVSGGAAFQSTLAVIGAASFGSTLAVGQQLSAASLAIIGNGSFGGAGSFVGTLAVGQGITAASLTATGQVTANGFTTAGLSSARTMTASVSITAPTITATGTLNTGALNVNGQLQFNQSAGGVVSNNAGYLSIRGTGNVGNITPQGCIVGNYGNGPIVGFTSTLADALRSYIDNSGNYTQVSDRRLKTNIAPITDGLAKVIALSPVSFDWISEGTPGLGFIAQDVQDVVPNIVHAGSDPDAFLAMSQSELIPLLVQAIQQQQAQIADLAGRLAALAPPS